MEYTSIHEEGPTHNGGRRSIRMGGRVVRLSARVQAILLLLCIATFFLGSCMISQHQVDATAASPGVNMACTWYRIVPGDTLGRISHYYGRNIWNLVQVNHIRNVNLIFAGRSLCIPTARSSQNGATNGIQPNGQVHWYDYRALQWSSRREITAHMHQVAAKYGLPANLLMAIAWQESGWNQHIIARDGGIGLMQIMPATAMGLNRQSRASYDPYKTRDNIELAAIYLRSLWRGFHGNLVRVISAYNEGGWAVQHRGIFNWRYVNNILALMHRYR